MRLLACTMAGLVLLLAAPGPILFEDVIGRSGIGFVLANHPTPDKALPETMAGGLAAFDYNNDGRTDLFFTNAGGRPALYRNDGGLHFTDVTAEAGFPATGYMIGAAAADFDNDGYVDLFLTGAHDCHLYRNAGGKTFQEVTKLAGIACPEWANAAAWFDYDRDGLLDLFVVNYLDWQPGKVCRDPSGRYTVYCNPRQFPGTANRLYHNLGGGRFEDVSESSGIGRHIGKGMSAAIADYDRDGFPDVYVTNDTEPNFLFHNLGNGQFEEVALEAGSALPDDGKPVSSMGVDFRDFNNDGLPDVAYTALTGETFPLFRNAGKSRFLDATFSSRLGRLTARVGGWGIAFADLNNDGWKDLFTANSHVSDNIGQFSGDRYELPDTLFANQGDGTFAAAQELGKPRAHRGAVVADFDGDGRLDIAVTVLGQAPELWRNLSAPAHHWIAFRLVGATSNRDSIGAVIHLGDQWNQQTSAIGYASSVLAPVHFGLGTKTKVPLVQIEWPSGTKKDLRDPQIDQVITVREPTASLR